MNERGLRVRTRGQAHGFIRRMVSPGDLGEHLKPFVFLDHVDGVVEPGTGFGWHPHSGIATLTQAYVTAMRGPGGNPACTLLDTRKTIPGLRFLEKYATRQGGAQIHRMGLWDAAMIKDNHVAAAGSVVAALRAVRAAAPELPCEVEVDTLEQLDEVLDEDVELILLDNFPVWQTQIAVQRRDAKSPGVLLESSGGLSLVSAAEYAGTGVDDRPSNRPSVVDRPGGVAVDHR